MPCNRAEAQFVSSAIICIPRCKALAYPCMHSVIACTLTVETANAAAGLIGSMTGLDTVEVVDVCLCYSAESQVLVMIHVLAVQL
jgi:hypothetical protein